MSPATKRLMERLISLAKGMLKAVEDWLKESEQEAPHNTK